MFTKTWVCPSVCVLVNAIPVMLRETSVVNRMYVLANGAVGAGFQLLTFAVICAGLLEANAMGEALLNVDAPRNFSVAVAL